MIPLDLPPLRERKDDISDLVKLFLKQFNREHQKMHEAKGEEWKSKVLLDRPEIYELLQAQDWREGNIAQLRRVVEEVLLKSPAAEVTAEDFQRVLEASESSRRKEPLDLSRSESSNGARGRRRPPIIITKEDIERYG
jgi:DNA-binding NtrC family response regulator